MLEQSCHTMQVSCPKPEGTARPSVFQLYKSSLFYRDETGTMHKEILASPCPAPWVPGSPQPCFVSLTMKFSVAIVLLIWAWSQFLQSTRTRCPCARDGHHHHAHCWTTSSWCSAVGFTTPCVLCQTQAMLQVGLSFAAVLSL